MFQTAIKGVKSEVSIIAQINVDLKTPNPNFLKINSNIIFKMNSACSYCQGAVLHKKGVKINSCMKYGKFIMKLETEYQCKLCLKNKRPLLTNRGKISLKFTRQLPYTFAFVCLRIIRKNLNFLTKLSM